MLPEVITILLYAFIASILALVGGIVFLFSKSWSNTLSVYSTPFAAGVLITVSLVGLLSESVHEIGDRAFTVVLLSFLIAYIFENFVLDIHHHEGHTHSNIKASVPLVIIGDTIHNFIDGVAIAATYFINPGLGLVTTISTFLHEVPHEIGDFGILLKAGWNRKKIVIVNILSASTTLLGAGFVLLFSESGDLIGYLLAIAAGLFLYLGATDFLPHVAEHDNVKKNMTALFLGVAIMLLTFNLIPHSHHEEEHSLSHEVEDEHMIENSLESHEVD